MGWESRSMQTATARNGRSWEANWMRAMLPLEWRDMLETPHAPWAGMPSGGSHSPACQGSGGGKPALSHRAEPDSADAQHPRCAFPRSRRLPPSRWFERLGGQVPPVMDSDARLAWWSLEVPEREISSLREECFSMAGCSGLMACTWNRGASRCGLARN